jgi:hypothetical protein
MKRVLCLVGLLALCARPAFAATITFDDIAVVGTNPIVTSAISAGFLFTSGHMHEVNDPAFSNVVGNGTQYLDEEAGALGLPITMTLLSGGAFSFSGVDGAEVFLSPVASFPNATTFTVVGTFQGGGTITRNFSLDGIADGNGGVADFQTFLVNPAVWNNLVSLTFSGSLVTGAPGGISFDNVQANAVPEPGSLLLLGSGLFAVARRLTKRS